MASPHATHEEIAAARRALFPADEPWNGTRDILGSIIEHCALCPKQRAEAATTSTVLLNGRNWTAMGSPCRCGSGSAAAKASF